MYITSLIYNYGSEFILSYSLEGLRWISFSGCVCYLKNNAFPIYHEYYCSFPVDPGHPGPPSTLCNLSWNRSGTLSSVPVPGWGVQALLILMMVVRFLLLNLKFNSTDVCNSWSNSCCLWIVYFMWELDWGQSFSTAIQEGEKFIIWESEIISF